MKLNKNDLIRYENQLFKVLETFTNGNIGVERLEDEERLVLNPTEVVIVQKYQSDIKDVTKSLCKFFEWMFSEECDEWIKVRFFLFVKFTFLFCAAFSLFIGFKFLIESL